MQACIQVHLASCRKQGRHVEYAFGGLHEYLQKSKPTGSFRQISVPELSTKDTDLPEQIAQEHPGKLPNDVRPNPLKENGKQESLQRIL